MTTTQRTTKNPDLSTIKQSIKLNAILSRYHRAEAARLRTQSRKQRAKGSTNRAYNLLCRMFQHRAEADALSYDQRHLLAALAFLTGRANPCGKAYLDPAIIARHFKSAKIFQTDAETLEAARLCIEGHHIPDNTAKLAKIRAIELAKADLKAAENDLVQRKGAAAGIQQAINQHNRSMVLATSRIEEQQATIERKKAALADLEREDEPVPDFGGLCFPIDDEVRA